MLILLPFLEDDVVNQARRADADGGCEDAGLEVGHLHVLHVEAVELGACPLGVLARERAWEGERRRPFGRGEVGVPGGQSEAVRIADRGEDADLEPEVEVAHHLRDDGDLLRVLLAEVGPCGSHDVEELEADGGHAAEVSGPVLAFEQSRKLFDLYPGLVARGIELLRRGSEQQVDTFLLGHARIALLVAWVAPEILAGAELRRVDEEADDDDLVLCPGGAEERQVPLVERAHRGNEADLAAAAELGAHLLDRPDRLHRAASASVA